MTDSLGRCSATGRESGAWTFGPGRVDAVGVGAFDPAAIDREGAGFVRSFVVAVCEPEIRLVTVTPGKPLTNVFVGEATGDTRCLTRPFAVLPGLADGGIGAAVLAGGTGTTPKSLAFPVAALDVINPSANNNDPRAARTTAAREP